MRLHRILSISLTALVLSAAVVLVGALTAAGQRRDDRPHLLVVPDAPRAESALARSSARVVARYDAFTLVEAEGDDARALLRAGADVRDDMRAVRLRGRSVDPARDRRPLRSRAARPRATGLALVQFVGPVKDAWLERVRDSGVRVVGYSAQNSYVVHGRAAELERLGELAGRDAAVRAAIAVEPADKLDVGVDTTRRQAVGIQTLSGADGDAARGAVERLGQQLRPPSAVGPLQTQFAALDGADVAQLADDPGVVAIEPYVEPELRDERAAQIVASNLTGTSPSAPGYLSFLTGKGFGSTTFDFAIDVTDEGLDKGVLPPPAGSHPDFYESGSASNPTRIAYQNDYTSDTNARDCGGHGTNVASIAAGFNTATGSAGATAAEDSSGFNYGLGIAPRARLGASKIFRCTDGAFDVGGTLTSLTAAAYAAGARVSNNSWGADTGGAYTSDSQEYDALVRDAQPAVAGNQQMVEVFAAGNAGSGTNTIGSPGTAKNVIAVGASENVRPAGTDGCGVTDSEANSANDIIDFSSRGPTDDQRIKPDVLAPGTHVTGASPQVGAEFNGSGTCNPQFPSGNTLYSLVSGTSQATPEASGMAALVRDWYRREHGGGSTPPSPAMTKAIMVNTATDVAGGSNGKGGTTAHVPNGDQGWGRIDLGAALDSTTRSFQDQNVLLRETGQELRRSYDVPDSTKPVKITLAWTDAPGPTVGNTFVNDLNLVVVSGGVTYTGNVLSGGQSITGGSPDPRNNVENVYLPAGTSGPVEVQVVAANLAADGVPEAGDETDQDFALVVSNGSEQAAPLVAHESTSVSDGAGDGDSVVEPGESFSLQETLRNSGTAVATSVSGSLTTTTAGVTVTDGTAAFPNLPAGATGANLDALTASVAGSVPCGTELRTTLDVTTAQGDFAIPISVPTGAASAPASRSSGEVPKSIPGNRTATVTSTLAVTAAGLIKDLDVRIGSLTHTWVGDLRISLSAPDGTTVVLADRPGGDHNGGDNFVNTVFDDEASTSISAGSPPYTGSFRPGGDQLSRFDGKQQLGTWTLVVQDLFPADGGSLQSWGTDTRTAQCSTSGGDTTPPAVTLTQPASGSAAPDTTPALSGGAGSETGDSETVTVNIWSGSAASGTPLHTLATTRSGGSWSTTAPTLAEGTYTARAEQSDSSSNVGVSSANTFRVDTSAPAVTVTSPADGAHTSDATPSLSGGAGSATGDSGTVTVKLWSGAGTTTGTPLHTLTTTRTGGSWSITAPALAQGAYTVVAEQADDAGNAGASAPRSFTVDITAPVLTLTTPAQGALLGDSTPVLSGAAGSATGDSSEVTVKVWAGTGSTGSPVRTFAILRSGASWSVEVTPALADGQYTARAEQTDLAGNSGASATRTFTVDTTPPDTSITGGPSGTVNSSEATFTFTSTQSGSTFECKLDAGSFQPCSSGTSYSELAEGSHTFSARASDAAGNTDASPATRTWTVDTTAPAVTLTTPADGAILGDSTPTLGGTAGESSDVTVKVWAGSGTTGAPVRTVTAAASAGSWSAEITPALANGEYTARAEQSDPAGNTGMSTTRTFTVDVMAPAVTLTTPDDGSFTNARTPVLSGAAGTAAGDLPTITLRIWSGTLVAGLPLHQFTTQASDSSWQAISPQLDEGAFTVLAEQTNEAGNPGTSDAHTFTVDTTSPVTTITAGPSGTVASGTAVFEFAASEPVGAFECRIDGAPFAACASGKAYSDLSDGRHSFEVRGIDRARNAGSPAIRNWTVSTFTPLDPSPLTPVTVDPPPARRAAPPLVMPVEGALGDVLRGGVPAQFACTGPCRADARLTLPSRAARRLGLASAARRVVVGRASRRLGEAGTAVVTVKLSRRARRALARVSSATMRLGLTVTEQSGERSALRHRLRLRRFTMTERLRRGVRLAVACSESCRATASVRVARRTATRLRLRRLTIARGALTLPDAGSGRLTAAFTREARRRLRRASLVPARLSVVVSAPAQDVTLARKLELRG